MASAITRSRYPSTFWSTASNSSLMRRRLSASVLPKLFVSSLLFLRNLEPTCVLVELSRLLNLNLPSTMHSPTCYLVAQKPHCHMP